MEPGHIARLEEVTAEYARLQAELGSPEVASDHKRYSELAKQASEYEEMSRHYADYKAAIEEAAEAREMLIDAATPDEKEFLETTVTEAEKRAAEADAALQPLLVPRDPRDDRAVIFEIRSGAGGDEAALFAGELMRMYQRYAERHGWKTEMLEASEGGVGGLKEAVFEVNGKGAFSALRHESGVHRVQRVPETESSGRTHTSTVTVAVLPVAEEVEVDVEKADLRIDTYRASGPGGQHVNTTDSAVRITHLPSGIVVAMQSERSQRQNHDRAMRVLMAKLKDAAEAEAHSERADARRSQVGTGDRSEKIRTYNFPQNRLTDHRINFSMHGIQQIMDGEIDPLIEALKQAALSDATL